MQFPIDDNQNTNQDLMAGLPTMEEFRLSFALLEEAIEAGDYEVFWSTYRNVNLTTKLVLDAAVEWEMTISTAAYLFRFDEQMIADILMLEWLVSQMVDKDQSMQLRIAHALKKDMQVRLRAESNPTLRMILDSAA